MTECEMKGCDLTIERLGGTCPVQGIGTVNGVPWYFRALGCHWSMAIGNDPVSISAGTARGWYRRRDWFDGPLDAGYMPRRVAMKHIKSCAREYVREMSATALDTAGE
jgi:hypothetical protein